MNAIHPTVVDVLPIVRGEFREIPGLHLTKPQVQRLWSLDATTCDALLNALLSDKFLRRTDNGNYALADTGF
jgi:hypothetical protein